MVRVADGRSSSGETSRSTQGRSGATAARSDETRRTELTSAGAGATADLRRLAGDSDLDLALSGAADPAGGARFLGEVRSAMTRTDAAPVKCAGRGGTAKAGRDWGGAAATAAAAAAADSPWRDAVAAMERIALRPPRFIKPSGRRGPRHEPQNGAERGGGGGEGGLGDSLPSLVK